MRFGGWVRLGEQSFWATHNTTTKTTPPPSPKKNTKARSPLSLTLTHLRRPRDPGGDALHPRAVGALDARLDLGAVRDGAAAVGAVGQEELPHAKALVFFWFCVWQFGRVRVRVGGARRVF